MLSNELKLLSTFELSFLNENHCHKICPCCGCHLFTEPTTEVRLSTIVILFGVGSFVCYKLLQRKRPKNGSSSLLDIINYLIYGCEETSNSSHEIDTYDINHEKEQNSSPTLSSGDTFNYDSLLTRELDDSNDSPTARHLKSRSFSQSSIFGNNTIVKLDELLNQIEDIKQSVAEMDADLFQVDMSRKKIDGQYLKLTSNVSVDEDINETIADEFSPSLEWDSNDVNFLELSEAKDILCESLLNKRHSFKTHRGDVSSSSSVLSSTPSTSSFQSFTSNKDSLLSTPDQEYVKTKTLQDLLDEAKRLGILGELIQALRKDSKRDSAYCED